jgi:hypothetical protein
VNDDMLTPQSLFIEPPRRDRITSISGVVQRRPIVLVLGMHRSGTSLCSHLLSALGVEMADKIPGPGASSPGSDNPRGHWERWEIVEFHDRILGLFNRDYLGRFHDFSLPVAWWADPRVVQVRHEIVGFLEKRMGDGYFGFKDPRTVRLMPVWHQIFNELKLAPKVVLCLRNPAQVARSLHARDGLDPEIGEYRWLVHMIDFFRYGSTFDYCAIKYEDWFDNPAANIEKLKKFLDLPWQQSEADLALLLSDVIDPSARHDAPTHQEAGQPLVRTLYQLASRDGQDGARDQIAYIVSQFVSFQQLQRPFLRAFEEVAKIAGKLPESEEQAAALRTALGERDAIIETAERRASDAEAALRTALGERDAIIETAERRASDAEARLAEAVAEREAALPELSRRTDELLAAQRAAQAELAAREAALGHAEQEAQERRVAALAMQSEIAALRRSVVQDAQERAATTAAMHGEITQLRGALVQAEGVARERADASAEMQAEITELRDALAQAEGAAREGADASAAMQAAIAELRDRLAQAAQEAQVRAAAADNARAEIGILSTAVARAERTAQERGAAGAAMQAEIASVRNQLAAAREVGRAALASLQTDLRAAPEATTSVGWLTPILRLIGLRTAGRLL